MLQLLARLARTLSLHCGHSSTRTTRSRRRSPTSSASRQTELAEPLLFGPLLPPRYRLDGPGALPDAAERLSAQLAASPRALVEPADIEAPRGFGLTRAADLVSRSVLV